MKHFTKFALAAAFSLPFALSLSGCPGDGSGDDEAGPSGNFCLHTCTADTDCTVGGMDLGLTCQSGTCTGEDAGGCTSNDECIAQLSGWTMACTSGGGECDALMQVCVDVGGGEGLCATPPSDVITCDSFGFMDYETTDIEGAPVTVCANANAECNADGVCFSPCQSDDDCMADSAPVCNTGTGLCECSTDADCATIGDSAASVCNNGTCGCGVDQDCVDSAQAFGDVCYDGFCGCSGDEVCADVPNSFDGGQISCRSI